MLNRNGLKTLSQLNIDAQFLNRLGQQCFSDESKQIDKEDAEQLGVIISDMLAELNQLQTQLKITATANG